MVFIVLTVHELVVNCVSKYHIKVNVSCDAIYH